MSVITATPNLHSHFRYLHWRPMPHSFGIPVASDFSDYPDHHPVVGTFKNCGLWTAQEAEILLSCARQRPGRWVDIGAHTMWTTAHIAAGGCEVDAVDPMLKYKEFQIRAAQNVYRLVESNSIRKPKVHAHTSDDFFLPAYQALNCLPIRGICIDGDHHDGIPQRDAINAARVLEPGGGVILMHDFTGRPVQDAALWLMDKGWNVRVYLTVHCIALAWRGDDFNPPDCEIDPRVAAQNLPARWPGFSWRTVLR